VEFATTRGAAEGVRAERELERARAEELLSAAEAARAAADAIRAEFAFEAPPAAARPANGSAPPAPATETLALPPAAPGEALALIGLDGTFKRLDDAFCSLLGHRESELRSARWPSVIDRENLAAHTEVARALRAGEIASAQVETVYMHAHGLLIPIAGTVSMHRADPSGPATHYLFRADVRRTSGG
jgi:PAS domain S-box-containing protein